MSKRESGKLDHFIIVKDLFSELQNGLAYKKVVNKLGWKVLKKSLTFWR
jgi:hypothetical protein